MLINCVQSLLRSAHDVTSTSLLEGVESRGGVESFFLKPTLDILATLINLLIVD